MEGGILGGWEKRDVEGHQETGGGGGVLLPSFQPCPTPPSALLHQTSFPAHLA